MGMLNFICKAVVPGRLFTRAMYDKLKVKDKAGNRLKQYHHVNLGASFIRDCAMWESFLENSDKSVICRPMIDIDQYGGAVELNFYSDASLNSNFGFGARFFNRWIFGKWEKILSCKRTPA